VPMQDGDFTPAAQSQVVTWNMKRLAPPSPLYVTVDDVLRVAAATGQGSEVVTVSYRLLRASDGKIVMGQFTVAPPLDRSLTIADQPLTEGFLLSVSCKAAVATTRGQTFVRLFLNPKALGPGQPGLMMMSDYVTTAMAPGFPNGRTLTPVEGPGVIRSLSFPSPGAGLDWSFSPPLNTRWRIMSILAALQTGPIVANRNPRLEVSVSGIISLVSIGPLNEPASSFYNYSWANWGSISTDGVAGYNAPLPPDLYVGPQSLISVNTNALNGGDTWQDQNILVEQWMDNV